MKKLSVENMHHLHLDAAKAMGCVECTPVESGGLFIHDGEYVWNPIKYLDQALSMADILDMKISHFKKSLKVRCVCKIDDIRHKFTVVYNFNKKMPVSKIESERETYLKLAIVQVAAQIGALLLWIVPNIYGSSPPFSSCEPCQPESV